MSKIKEMELMGWRELTDAEVGYLQTSRNYAGALIMKFISMKKDAAAIDLNSGDESSKLQEKLRYTISKAALARYLQVYCQGKTVIISKVRFGEDLVLSPEQEAKFK